MRRFSVAASVSLAWLVLTACTPSIELVGYGAAAPIQHGLELRLVSTGASGAMIQARNTTDELLAIAVSGLAVQVELRRAGQVVVPTARVTVDKVAELGPDDFAILAPGQTRAIPVPLSLAADELRAHGAVYTIEKGALYEIEVRIEPYFGRLSDATAAETLARFKIPSYVRETLRPNTMTIRLR